MHACEVHACEVHACEVHACEVHVPFSNVDDPVSHDAYCIPG